MVSLFLEFLSERPTQHFWSVLQIGQDYYEDRFGHRFQLSHERAICLSNWLIFAGINVERERINGSDLQNSLCTRYAVMWAAKMKERTT